MTSCVIVLMDIDTGRLKQSKQSEVCSYDCHASPGRRTSHGRKVVLLRQVMEGMNGNL